MRSVMWNTLLFDVGWFQLRMSVDLQLLATKDYEND